MSVAEFETLFVALVFAAVYGRAGRISHVRLTFPERWLSVAAGVSVAYVFVELLPELELRSQDLLKMAGGDLLYAEKHIYIYALVGFAFFYGLDAFLLRSRVFQRLRGPEGTPDAAFWVHVGGYAPYSWVLGYLLIDRAAAGEYALAFYAIAMALHLTVLGTGLGRDHGRAYERFGWWVLAASVLVGWLVSVTVRAPEDVIHRLFAFVAGGVMLTSMNAELPHPHEGQFWWFLVGSVAFAVLLLLAV